MLNVNGEGQWLKRGVQKHKPPQNRLRDPLINCQCTEEGTMNTGVLANKEKKKGNHEERTNF